MTMTITINGEARSFEGDVELTVEALLEGLGLGGRRLAVELNREIVRRGTYAERLVADGDVIEIVHFVGGGA